MAISRLSGFGNLFKYAAPGFIFISIFLFLTGCNSEPSSTGGQVLKSAAPKVHVAFSGGGWRAHTGHAGWIISLLGNGKQPLDRAFTNVGTISANSGGSWFSTMLMYSDVFDQNIQAQNAIAAWDSTGWLGQQRTLFKNAPKCRLYPYPLCVADYYTNHNPYLWDSVVVDLVFRDYPLGALPLSGARRPWATNKPLLLAATLLTNNVVLNSSNGGKLGDKRYYQTCLSPIQPVLKGYGGSTCNNGSLPDVSPVTFTSIPGGSNLQPLPFLRQPGMNNQFNVGYTENAYFSPDTAQATLQNPFSTDQVPVIIAAAASSAAAGFVASETVTNDWLASWAGEDEALVFQLANATVQHTSASGRSVSDLAQQKMVRIADGGAIDNTGVAQLVSFLQFNNQADNFSIAVFDNVQSVYSPPSGSNGAMAGIDIANLFGLDLPSNSELCFEYEGVKRCLTLPPLQIFDSAAMKITPSTWQYFSGKNGVICTKYNVTTVDNSVLGVAGGTKGTVYAFTCVWPNASTAPVGNSDFDTYNDMLQFIYTNMNGGKGRQFLNEAFGL